MAKKRDVPVHGRKSARFHRARKKRYLVVAGGAYRKAILQAACLHI